MSDQLGDHLFTFAVVADTHVNHGESQSNSEFEINKGANGRLRHVVRDLNRRRLAFVIHLGDVVHPVPALPDLYEAAAARFREQVAELRHRLHLVPGNHDIGDKPIDWGPAGVVCEDFIALWRKNFGPNFTAFDHGGCRFFLVDAQIINSGLAAEAAQETWLETGSAAAEEDGKRIFLATHYPPFLTEAGEDEHFDNIAEPGRSWLLGLMNRHRVEALFSGHVHNVWYNRLGLTDCYALPSTAFVRQDYAEIYRSSPPPDTDGGRADLAKLGYFLVRVHEGGHLCQWVRTFGRIAEPASAETAAEAGPAAIHPRENPNTRFGFDMRQSWLEIVEIPPSGSLDEFDRKRTRNDYALIAVLEMGVGRLRIPARDLLDPGHRRRLDDCARQGLRFTLFSYGVPDQSLRRAVADARDLVDCWEIGHDAASLAAVARAAANAVAGSGPRLYMTKLRSKQDAERGGGTYHHMISHGFTPEDREQIAAVAELEGIDGVVFRVEGGLSPWRAAREAAAACRGTGLALSLHVRMTLGKPGDVQIDDDWVATRMAESLATVAAHRDIQVYPDTFADVDRGYFRRHGVVDRFYNPRKAFHVVRHLNAALAPGLAAQPRGAFEPLGGAEAVAFQDRAKRRYRLLSPGSQGATERTEESGSIVNLLSGEQCSAARAPDGRATPSWPSGPLLWISEP